MHYLKKFFKSLLTVLLIALITFCCYRFYQLKKEGKIDKLFENMEKDDSFSSVEAFSSGENVTKAMDGTKNKNTNTKKESSSDSTFVVEEKNYDDYYNKFNFDNVLLLYEGEQKSSAAKEALDVLITDAEGNLYSKPAIVFENFSGLSSNEITYENVDEYISVLKQARNSIGNGTYTFTFGYVGFTTSVNKITITKN